jgi:hypothetical protein
MASQLAIELDGIAEDGLFLPAPDDDAYHLVGREVEILTRRTNHDVAVFFWAVGPRVVTRTYTEGPLVHRALAVTPFAMEVHSRLAPQKNFEAMGKVLEPDTVELWRAERYVGAMLEVMFKNLGDDTASLFVNIVRDEARLDNVTSEHPFAVGRTEWIATQDVTIPNPDYDTV